jgi:hypothetical protein
MTDETAIVTAALTATAPILTTAAAAAAAMSTSTAAAASVSTYLASNTSRIGGGYEVIDRVTRGHTVIQFVFFFLLF